MAMADIGSFLTGADRGLNFGVRLAGLYQDSKVARTAAQGMKDVKDARQREIDASIIEGAQSAAPVTNRTVQQARTDIAALQPQQAPTVVPAQQGAYRQQGIPDLTQSASQVAGMPEMPAAEKTFSVGKKTYTDRKAAVKDAERLAGNLMDRYYAEVGPKIRETYLSQGRVNEAQQFDDFLQAQSTKRGTKLFAKGAALLNMGDYRGAIDSFMDAQKVQGYGDDTVEITGYEAVNDDKGKETGAVRMKFKIDGVDGYRDFDSEEEVAMFGMASLNPDTAFKSFETRMKQAAEARQAATKRRTDNEDFAARERYKSTLRTNEDAQKQEQQQRGRIEELNTRARLGIGMGGGAGGSQSVNEDGTVNPGYRRSMSIEDRRAAIYNSLVKDVPGFLRKSAEDQDKLIEQAMARIYRNGAVPAPGIPGGGGDGGTGVPLVY